jgi:hypothetical protein
MPEFKSQLELDAYVVKIESDMREAAKRFEFEKAAKLRDTIKELRTKEFLFVWEAVILVHGDFREKIDAALVFEQQNSETGGSLMDRPRKRSANVF